MERNIKKLKGPILIFGAGGFIGFNILQSILKYRSDVFGVTRSKSKNWRFLTSKIHKKQLVSCDLNKTYQLQKILNKLKPKTVFNLATYGAYSSQNEYKKIYMTNIISSVDILERLKQFGFYAYVQAGSSSEYGLNASAPTENMELIPNSHYAVTKVSSYFLLKYYGKIEKLPVIHLRLYSAFGPWEEPDRLMPVLLSSARKGKLPPFVDPNISRDFVYVEDVVSAFIAAGANIKEKLYGEAFNVATGKLTTIKNLALLVRKMMNIQDTPKFGTMKNRKWDLSAWYGNNNKIANMLNWKPSYSLKGGLEKTVVWQNEINYDKLLKRIQLKERK